MVAVFSTIILTIMGLRVFFLNGLTTYHSATQAQHWVVQEGQKTPFGGSTVRADEVDALSVDGRTESLSLHYYEDFRYHDRSWPVVFYGVDPEGRLTPSMLEGTVPRDNNQLAIDSELAQFMNLGVGDIVPIADYQYTVSGVTMSYGSQAHVPVFMSPSALARITKSDTVSAVAVFGDVVSTPDRLWVRSQDQFLADTEDYIGGSVDPFIGIIIAVCIIGLSLLLAVKLGSDLRQRSRIYGLFKLVGASNAQLVRAELSVSARVLLTGTAVSIPLAVGLLALLVWPPVANIIELIGPPVRPGPFDLLAVLILLGACYSLGLILPTRRLSKLSPMAFLQSFTS